MKKTQVSLLPTSNKNVQTITVARSANKFEFCWLKKRAEGLIFLYNGISVSKGQEREREVENPLLLLGTGSSSRMRQWDRGNPLPPRFSSPRSKRMNQGQVQQWRNRRRKQRQGHLSVLQMEPERLTETCWSVLGRTHSSRVRQWKKHIEVSRTKYQPLIHKFGKKDWKMT